MALPKRIIIVGGGSAGWIAASLFKHNWEQYGIEITVIESEKIGIIGVGEGSTPSLKYFFKKLGIKEAEWMPFCNATYKCGISFPNWTTHLDNNEYFHPFYSDHDWKTGQAFIHNCNLRRKGYDINTDTKHYWLQAKLAEQSLSPKLISPQAKELDYGYHFDSEKLGEFLKRRAKKLGINHIIDTVETINHDDSGITSLVLESGTVLDADLYIDATGFSSLLLQKTLKVPFSDYKDYLFNDRAVAIPTPQKDIGNIKPQTVSRALSAGWAWTIPLSNRNGNGYVYSSKYLSENDAEEELKRYLNISSHEEVSVRHLSMRLGRVERHWYKNVLAVGLSQGFIEPLEATALSCIQFTVEHFIDNFSIEQQFSAQQSRYNAKINEVYDAIRDYICAHYRLNTRHESNYWRDNRNAKIPNTLKNILTSWDDPNSDFELTLKENNAEIMYFSPSWYCLFAGKGRFNDKAHQLCNDTKHANVKDVDNYCHQQAQHFLKHALALPK